MIPTKDWWVNLSIIPLVFLIPDLIVQGFSIGKFVLTIIVLLNIVVGFLLRDKNKTLQEKLLEEEYKRKNDSI
ncbi:hypothetical protein CVD28_00680 [Bacillus sp. M6-12]|uniref:hypothetical protein n=1 Tax=Bacillus sp. M6-12 TaxID=2054166 RepID=UPI000C76ED28|nr:hypothetical protein [Bacillus sp. M6-12]PLS18948.1 hypothetical protein CVD28_00680 [Bacillus sp. M6-12]